MQRQRPFDQSPSARQVLERIDGDRNVEAGRLSSAPDNPGMDVVGERAVDDDLVDETAQERLLLRPAEHVALPDRGQLLTQVKERRPQSGIKRQGLVFLLETVGLCLLFGGFERTKRLLPALFEFGSHQAIVGIYSAELPLHETCFIPQPLHLLGVGPLPLGKSRVMFAQDLVVQVELSRSQYREEGRHHLCVDRIGRDILTDGGAVAMLQFDTAVAWTRAIGHLQLVSRLAAVDQTLQERAPLARHASGAVARIRSSRFSSNIA